MFALTIAAESLTESHTKNFMETLLLQLLLPFSALVHFHHVIIFIMFENINNSNQKFPSKRKRERVFFLIKIIYII